MTGQSGRPQIANLATLSAAKDYIRPDGTEDDATIQRLLTWASGRIRTFTQRNLTHPTVTEERKIYFYDTKSVMLDDKLENVTQIVAPVDYYVEGEPYPFERNLEPEEYELRQIPTGTQLRLDQTWNGLFRVTGTWGWATVPGDLEYATIVTADEWYRSNIIAAYGGQEEGERTEGRNIDLPREVKEMLDAWAPKASLA